MPEDIKILTSRRGYEFTPDGLRLSMLSTKPLLDHIQQQFQFQVAVVGSPMPTFGDVPATIPAGVVFNTGVLLSRNGQFVPIRFLHFEQRRVVIDVAGATSAIDEIFDLIIHSLNEIHAPDGSPIIGTAEDILEYSEISAQFSFSLDSIFTPPLQKLLQERITVRDSEKELVLVPTIALQAFSNQEKILAAPGANDFRAFTFTIRAGTRPEKRIYFSGAPLSSEAHINYIKELEIALTR